VRAAQVKRRGGRFGCRQHDARGEPQRHQLATLPLLWDALRKPEDLDAESAALLAFSDMPFAITVGRCFSRIRDCVFSHPMA